MGESKVLEEILDKLFMGGMTLAGLDPTNGLLYPKSELLVKRRVLSTRGWGELGAGGLC